MYIAYVTMHIAHVAMHIAHVAMHIAHVAMHDSPKHRAIREFVRVIISISKLLR